MKYFILNKYESGEIRKIFYCPNIKQTIDYFHKTNQEDLQNCWGLKPFLWYNKTEYYSSKLEIRHLKLQQYFTLLEARTVIKYLQKICDGDWFIKSKEK